MLKPFWKNSLTVSFKITHVHLPNNPEILHLLTEVKENHISIQRLVYNCSKSKIKRNPNVHQMVNGLKKCISIQWNTIQQPNETNC